MKIRTAILILLSGACSLALENEIKTEPGAGTVKFEAIGRPNMLFINGTGEGVSSNLKIIDSKISGEVSFRLESLKTGIEQRDHDMKEKYLEIKQYPLAKLIFSQFQMPAGWSIKNPKVVESSFRGKFLLHGVEREITGLYSIDPSLKKSTAKFDIKLSDFKIQLPEYLGIKVADFVKVSVVIDKLEVVK